ncbi:Tubulin polyglutamylase complex subunit 1 [Terramyces sp. JEL0728]|nr:Tubulin polyglutamylase complex subunit 1 [Terramyces sp. JEL0728]
MEVAEILIAALKKPNDRIYLLNIEQQLAAFINDQSKNKLRFDNLNSYQRLMVHKLADLFGLDHVVSNKTDIVMYKNSASRLSEIKLSDLIPNYQTGQEHRVVIQANRLVEPKKVVQVMRQESEKSMEEKELEYQQARARILGNYIEINEGIEVDVNTAKSVPRDSFQPRYQKNTCNSNNTGASSQPIDSPYAKTIRNNSAFTPLIKPKSPANKIFFPMLKILDELPKFKVDPEDITVISTPVEFFNHLKSGIRNAKSKIILVSLYIGDERIVTHLEDALNRGVQVEILVDYFRGTRTEKELDMLAGLQAKFPHLKVSYYKSPNVGPIIEKIVPPRFIEGFGLQHIKLYQFDSRVIISGANLNTDYFENRQDRYLSIECNELCEYFYDIISLISKYSANLENGKLIPNKLLADNQQEEYKASFGREISNLLCKWQIKTNGVSGNTIISPALQIYNIGVTQDEKAMLKLLKLPNADFHIAAGYLNLPQIYERILIQSSSKFSITTSAPEQNGFFGSKGISSFIPHAYSYLQYQFIKKIKNENIKVFEYNRKGWTWHAKGLWVSYGNEFVCVTGSSNINFRSLRRDMEAQLYITTRDSHLKNQLQGNLKYLNQHSAPSSLGIAKSRYLPPHIKLLTKIIKSML